MKRILPLLLSALIGCSTAVAEPPTCGAMPEARLTWDGIPRSDLSMVDVRGNALSVELIQQDLHRLSPEDRARAVESMRLLLLNDPFTRASVQLPLVMHQVVMGIEPRDMDPLMHQDWEYLRQGLSTHVAVLDALEADLPMPARGDRLRSLGAQGMVDRQALLASPQPTQTMAPLYELMSVSLEGKALELVRLHTHTLDQYIGQWSMRAQTTGWQRTLRRVEPFVTEPATQTQIRELILAADGWLGEGC